MILIIHKVCNGPAIETDTLLSEACALPVNNFPFNCLTCLDEITDESELRFSEELPM
jgi:hypothetical protein